MAIFYDRAFDRGCKKVFKIILYHYNMQKLFLFPINLLFHPNKEDRQDLNIEQRKLNEITETERKGIERANT